MIFNSKGILRTYQGVFAFCFKLLDPCLLVASGMLAHVHFHGGMLHDSSWKVIILIAALTFTVFAQQFHLYQPWRGKKMRHELLLLALLSLLTVASVSLSSQAIGLLPLSNDPLTIYLAWLLYLTSALTAVRLIIRPILKALRRNGVNQRHVVLVGMNAELDNYIAELNEHPEFGFSFIGYVDERSEPRDDFRPGLKRLGSIDQLSALCQKNGADQIWFGYPIAASQRLGEAVNLLKHHPIVIRQILELASPGERSNPITNILSKPILDIDVTRTDGVLGNLAKSIQDKVLAATILLAVSPLMLTIAMAIKLTSPGPIFYRQTRLTWRNQPFEIVKFRSMPVDVEKHSGPRWATKDGNRATTVGAFLRSTSLDELPQFWNVLKGEMSIVGPRPERPELVEKFKNEIPLYMKKHRVKAGITGWAQINGYRGDTDLNKRIEHDLHYIRNNSFLFDLQIILLTMYKGFTSRHAY